MKISAATMVVSSNINGVDRADAGCGWVDLMVHIRLERRCARWLLPKRQGAGDETTVRNTEVPYRSPQWPRQAVGGLALIGPTAPLKPFRLQNT